MRPIPKKLREKLAEDEVMKTCGYHGCSSQMVQWHHVYMYGGRQIQEAFNILPACEKHHHQATPHNNEYIEEVKEYFEWVAIQKMDGEMEDKYPKFNWKNHSRYLFTRAKKHEWD